MLKYTSIIFLKLMLRIESSYKIYLKEKENKIIGG